MTLKQIPEELTEEHEKRRTLKIINPQGKNELSIFKKHEAAQDREGNMNRALQAFLGSLAWVHTCCYAVRGYRWRSNLSVSRFPTG